MSTNQHPRPVLVLQPSVNTTVVTTTTVTTTSYAPIQLPPLPRPISPKDPKSYPLLNAKLPKSLREFPLVFPNGARATFTDGDGESSGDLEMAEEQELSSGVGWRMVKRDEGGGQVVDLEEAVERFGRKREREMEVDTTRKRARPMANDTPSSSTTTLSPLPSPHGSPPPQANAPLAPDMSLTTLLTLPTLLAHFTSLPPPLQSHFLLTLLRHSPLPVLRTLHTVLTPTLARDFLSLLPAELVAHVLGYLSARTLLRAGRVCRSWRARVDEDGVLWRDLMMGSGVWFGGESERAFGRAVEVRRRRARGVIREREEEEEGAGVTPPSTPTPTPTPFPSTTTLPPSHPYKLLFKSRHLTLSSYLSNPAPWHISFPAHGSAVVTCLLFSHGRVISASDDHSICVFDPWTGRRVWRLEGHEGGVWALGVAGAGVNDRGEAWLVSGSTDRTVRIWDLSPTAHYASPSERCIHVFGGHTSTVRCLSIIKPEWVDVPVYASDASGEVVRVKRERWPKRPLIVTGSRDHSLRVWTLPRRGERGFRCFDGPPSGSLSSTSNSNSTTTNTTNTHTNPNPPKSPSPSPDHTPDASSNPYHRAHLVGHDHAVRALAARGRTLVSGSYDCTVRMWDVVRGVCVWVGVGHGQKVYSVVLDLPRQQAMSGSMDGTVRLWALANGACTHVLTGHTSLVGLLSLSPSHLVSAAADSTLRVWDPKTGECRWVLGAHVGAITCFWHDEWKVLSGSDGCLKMWSLRGEGGVGGGGVGQAPNVGAQVPVPVPGANAGVGVNVNVNAANPNPNQNAAQPAGPAPGTVVRDLLTGITGVWQVVSEGRWCVAASNRNDVTMLDVWDFGRGVGDGGGEGGYGEEGEERGHDENGDGDENDGGGGEKKSRTRTRVSEMFGKDEPEDGWIGEPAGGWYDEGMFDGDEEDDERDDRRDDRDDRRRREERRDDGDGDGMDEDDDGGRGRGYGGGGGYAREEEDEDPDGPEVKWRALGYASGSRDVSASGGHGHKSQAHGKMKTKAKDRTRSGVGVGVLGKAKEVIDLSVSQGDGDVEMGEVGAEVVFEMGKEKARVKSGVKGKERESARDVRTMIPNSKRTRRAEIVDEDEEDDVDASDIDVLDLCMRVYDTERSRAGLAERLRERSRSASASASVEGLSGGLGFEVDVDFEGEGDDRDRDGGDGGVRRYAYEDEDEEMFVPDSQEEGDVEFELREGVGGFTSEEGVDIDVGVGVDVDLDDEGDEEDADVEIRDARMVLDAGGGGGGGGGGGAHPHAVSLVGAVGGGSKRKMAVGGGGSSSVMTGAGVTLGPRASSRAGSTRPGELRGEKERERERTKEKDKDKDKERGHSRLSRLLGGGGGVGGEGQSSSTGFGKALMPVPLPGNEDTPTKPRKGAGRRR